MVSAPGVDNKLTHFQNGNKSTWQSSSCESLLYIKTDHQTRLNNKLDIELDSMRLSHVEMQ